MPATSARPAGDFSALTTEGLTEAAAVDVALANNAGFQEQLADLGLTRADVVQAGLIANPQAVLLLPVGPKQLEATVTAPLESLWLRGLRTESAHLANERNAARLVQLGLDLVRDVRLAYADLGLARRRLVVTNEARRLREQVASIAGARVRGGDAVPLDALTARIDALRADQEARNLWYAATIAEERLRTLLGAGALRTTIALEAVRSDPRQAEPDVEALVPAALGDRPDLRSARLAVDEARRRAALARVEWINLSLVADANERGPSGFEAGPGFGFILPIFNQNQGAIARADAQVESLERQLRTLGDRVVLEVREAHARYQQAGGDLEAWRSHILPALEQAVRLAERSYQNGETPLVQVLDTNRQLLDAQAREAQAAADARRAWAELERSVGRRLDAGAPAGIPTTAPSTMPAAPSTMPTGSMIREGNR